MRRNTTLFALALLVGFGLSTTLDARAGGVGEAPSGKREQVHELIMARLNSELGLTPEQSERLSRILRKSREQRVALKARARELTGQLRSANAGGDEKKIHQAIKQLSAVRVQLDGLDEQRFNEVKAILVPRQQAKYLLVMEDIRREVQAVRRASPPEGSPAAGAVRPSPP